MRYSTVEVLLISSAAVNALAELSNLLPVTVSGKITAALFAIWAILRFILRFLHASPASIREIEDLRTELHCRVNEIQAKRAERVGSGK